jgi:lipopolysaccharide transport system permease protein
MREQLIEIFKYKGMLWNLIVKELNARYKRSIIGFFWSFLNPILMMMVYSLVFSTVMRVNIQHYELFLLTNLLPWTFFQTSLISAMTSIVNNSNLVKKVYFPHEVLPFSVILANLINFLLSLLVLLIAFVLLNISIHHTVVFLPFIIVIELMMVMGLGLILAALNTFFRDVEHIANVFLFAWFYVTPVLYPLNLVPKNYSLWFQLNPMSPIIDAYSKIIYLGVQPDFRSLGVISLVACLLLYFGLKIFGCVKRSFAEEI